MNSAPEPKEPTRFAGVVMTSSSGRLLLTGPQPGWLQVATGRFRPIAGLPEWRLGYEFTRVAGGWAVQRYSPAQATCQVCDAPPPVYFIADGQTRATVVGAAYAAAAAATPGELWLTSYLPEANIGTTSGTAQEVTLTGQAVGPPSQLPAGYVIDRAVRGGLLLTPYVQRPGLVTDELWDPATRRVVFEFPNVIAASSAQIAWNPCLGKCPLKVLRLSTKARLTIPLTVGTWADVGTFSSDGRLLAVQVASAVQSNGYAAATRLQVIELASGKVTVLPGATIGSQIAVSFGWQAGADLLKAALVRPSGLVQVASWQPGDKHLAVQVLSLPNGTWPVLGDHE